MKQPLSHAIKRKMARHSLSDQQLAALRQRIETAAAPPAPRPAPRLKLAGLLATVFMTALFTALLLPRFDLLPKASMAQQIADEVVKNHLNLKPLEVQSNTLDGLMHYFTQLDFLLRPSREVDNLKGKLLGGRYCSLQGITAAQLRLQSHAGGKPDTLYQTEYRKEVFGPLPDIDRGQQPLEVWSRGIKVKVWVEKGVVFALTDVTAASHE